MNKRYMDFVPPKADATKNIQAPRPVQPVTKPVQPVARPVQPRPQISKPVTVKTKPAPVSAPAPVAAKPSFALKKEPDYGVIEDYKPAFVKTTVEKRPLSQPHFVRKKTDLEAAKAVKTNKKPIPTAKPKASLTIAKKSTQKKKDDFESLKASFINTDKVEKRPLSKNVYKKPEITTKEEPIGPVTIIDKPEKESHVGLVITILLTIVLGAAIGTVAFLLFPR